MTGSEFWTELEAYRSNPTRREIMAGVTCKGNWAWGDQPPFATGVKQAAEGA